MKKVSFSVTPDVLGVLGMAGTSTGHEEIVGHGDLCQMAAQGRFLASRGFDVGHQDVYPALRTKEDADRAYRLFWEHKVDGWWNMSHEFLRRGICSEAEFIEALDKETR